MEEAGKGGTAGDVPGLLTQLTTKVGENTTLVNKIQYLWAHGLLATDRAKALIKKASAQGPSWQEERVAMRRAASAREAELEETRTKLQETLDAVAALAECRGGVVGRKRARSDSQNNCEELLRRELQKKEEEQQQQGSNGVQGGIEEGVTASPADNERVLRRALKDMDRERAATEARMKEVEQEVACLRDELASQREMVVDGGGRAQLEKKAASELMTMSLRQSEEVDRLRTALEEAVGAGAAELRAGSLLRRINQAEEGKAVAEKQRDQSVALGIQRGQEVELLRAELRMTQAELYQAREEMGHAAVTAAAAVDAAADA